MEATVGLVAGSGWASGVNLYAVVALLGVLGRAGAVDIPELLRHPLVIVVAVGLYLVEFVVDKIPYVDNAWDAVHTVVRPTGAALLGAVLAGEVTTLEQAGAALGSGALALSSHTAKATLRAALNTSPEPVSNIFVSLLEDGLVAAVVWFAVEHPVLALVLVAVLTVAAVVMTVALWRVARRAVQRLRDRTRRRLNA